LEGIEGRTPSIDDETLDLRARLHECLVQPIRAIAVVLHRDAPTLDAFCQEVVAELGGGLRLRNPVCFEASRLDRAARLGAARDEARVPQRCDERFRKTRRVRRLYPP